MTFKHRDIVIAYMDGEEVEWKHGNTWEPLVPIRSNLTYGFYDDYEYRIKSKEPMFRIFKRNGGTTAKVLVRNSINPIEAGYYQTIIKEENIIYLTDWLPFPHGTKV